MALDAEHPTCPKHLTVLVPNPLEPPDVILPRSVEVFRCSNPKCSIFYATGVLEGFYTLQNGQLVPYLKEASA